MSTKCHSTPDFHLSEAISTSYILHCCVLMCFAIVAMYWFVPKPKYVDQFKVTEWECVLLSPPVIYPPLKPVPHSKREMKRTSPRLIGSKSGTTFCEQAPTLKRLVPPRSQSACVACKDIEYPSPERIGIPIMVQKLPRSLSNGRGLIASPDFGPYMADLRGRLRRAWFPPRHGGPVVVKFTISKSGELSNLVLYKSCGISIGDDAALRAVGNAAPFRPLSDYADESVEFECTFDYSIYGGNGTGKFHQF